jgi:uncharacterized protein YndB with AHSA1/START domain
MADYNFVTRWFIDAPIERVFSVIEDAPRWPSWWKEVVAVEVVESGDADGIGAVARTTWRTALGYRLHFDARLIRRTSPERLEVESAGELLGHGRWELSREAGGTLVVYFWDVTTTPRWMNVLAPVMRPAFQWKHAVVMRRGGEGLARLLAARFEDRS